MKIEERLGIEYLKHQKAVEDITFFYNVIKRYKIIKGGLFVEPHSGDVYKCWNINYDKLLIEYCHPGETTITDFNYRELVNLLKNADRL